MSAQVMSAIGPSAIFPVPGSSNASHPAPQEDRKAIRCPRCRLMQFMTPRNKCRRCHVPLYRLEDLSVQEVPEDRSAGDLVEARKNLGTVGRAFRFFREERHISQEQAARLMDLPRTYISKIENGKAAPTLRSIERLAAVLGISVSELMDYAFDRRAYLLLHDPWLTGEFLENLRCVDRALWPTVLYCAGHPKEIASVLSKHLHGAA